MKYLLFAFTLLLGGCLAIPYQSFGLSGGYRDWALEEKNTFQVKFSGNADVKPEVAADYALLRSAVLTKENGFEFFEVLDKKSKTLKSYTGTMYTYKPTFSLSIRLIPSDHPMTNRTYNSEILIKELTEKYNITEY